MSLDEDTFAVFYQRSASGLWRYLRRLAGNEAMADDLVQESFIKFLGVDASHLPREPRQRTAYLYRIATNLLRDRWRREKREEGWLTQLLFSRSARQETAPRADLRMDLDTVLARLKQQERALLLLAYVEGYDHREIAEILGLKSGSIRVLLFRARKKLMSVLAEHGFDTLPMEISSLTSPEGAAS